MHSCFNPAIRTLIACFAFALLAAGCGDAVVGDKTSDTTMTVPTDTTITIPTDTTTASSPTVDFGPHYVLLNDPTPRLDGDTLRATVAYSGGCAVHTFPLRGRTDSLGGAALWLQHDIVGGRDDCEAFPSQTIAQFVPEPFASLRPLRLIAPDSLSPSYVLAR